MGRQSMTLYGKDKIEDQLSEVTYHISDLSFYKLTHHKLKNFISKL